jgi:hypothetical protein
MSQNLSALIAKRRLNEIDIELKRVKRRMADTPMLKRIVEDLEAQKAALQKEFPPHA